MPAQELLALAERWHRDPTGAAQDGQLLAATRAALASLDSRERAALGHQLRAHGAERLASQLEVSDRLPVWSDEFTSVARDLLTVDDATLADLRAAVTPQALSDLEAPEGTPVALPPPPLTDTPADLPPPSPRAWQPAAWEPTGHGAHLGHHDGRDLGTTGAGSTDVHDPGGDAPATYATETYETEDHDAEGYETEDYAPADYEPEDYDAETYDPATYQPEGYEPEGDEPGTHDAGTDDPGTTEVTAAEGVDGRTGTVPHGTGAGQQHRPRGGPPGPSYEPVDALAPGMRSTVTARERFEALDRLTGEDLDDPTTVQAVVLDAPDGWQRRRVVLRLLDGGVTAFDVEAVLGALARPADRTTVADRLVRHQVADLHAVLAHLPAPAAARLRRRHGGT